MMKAKKWMALALSAVMAVGMLTGCGGTGSAGRSSLNTSSVNSLIREADSKVRVSSDAELNAAMDETIALMEQGGMGKNGESLHSYLIGVRNYKSGSNRKGASFVLTESELEAGISADWIASVVNTQTNYSVSTTQAGAIAPIDTAEKVAAVAVLSVSEQLDPIVEQIGGKCTYNVSGKTLKTKDETVYWLISIEIVVDKL